MNTLQTPPDLPDAVERVAASVVGLSTRRHAGSGVLWREGVVVASASLVWRAAQRYEGPLPGSDPQGGADAERQVGGSPQVALILPDGERVAGEVRGVDGGTDLAAITFSGGTLALPSLAEAAAPRVGDFVFATGRNASGLTQASFGHVGAVAGEWRTWRGGRVEQLIRLDGGLYPGFDGAPVADAAGRVLGIASSALSRHHGVVLPVATVERVLAQLLAHGHLPSGYLGIAAQPVRATLDGAAVDGLLVSSVADDGPAARGGLRVADVIVRIDGQPVDSLEALRERLQPGAQVAALVARGGQSLTLRLEVAQRPQPTGRCR